MFGGSGTKERNTEKWREGDMGEVGDRRDLDIEYKSTSNSYKSIKALSPTTGAAHDDDNDDDDDDDDDVVLTQTLSSNIKKL
ncbi:hypothetical protein HZH68_004287 [Vespula germanica]|uniref:Uncharacterized protein n=1 Tax=Vespula germanica TaxID=30212 RepID=A0A834KTL2_VESGE|nr:hypothetical protein HZH68_004287 [Vespula germanica]